MDTSARSVNSDSAGPNEAVAVDVGQEHAFVGAFGRADLMRRAATTIRFFYGDSRKANDVGRLIEVHDSAGVLKLKYDPRGNVKERRRTLYELEDLEAVAARYPSTHHHEHDSLDDRDDGHDKEHGWFGGHDDHRYGASNARDDHHGWFGGHDDHRYGASNGRDDHHERSPHGDHRHSPEKRKRFGNTYVTGYDYDSMSRLSRITYPDGFKVKYYYGAAGLVSEIRDGDGQLIAEVPAYTSTAQIERIVFGNGVASDMAYDTNSRMSSLVTITPDSRHHGPTPLQSFSYGYDLRGNVLSIADAVRGNDQSFEYDERNFLTRAAGKYYGERSYEYDAGGNLLRRGDFVYLHDSERQFQTTCAIDLRLAKRHQNGLIQNRKLEAARWHCSTPRVASATTRDRSCRRFSIVETVARTKSVIPRGSPGMSEATCPSAARSE